MWYKIFFSFLIGLMLPVLTFGQNEKIQVSDLQSGDLIFQNLDCGDLCDAIEAVTPAFNGEHFSHIGIIYRHNGKLSVIEAIGKTVHVNPLKKVLNRTVNTCYIGRLKPKDAYLVKEIIRFSLKQRGLPYDKAFCYDNGKYYCSELIYDAFKSANNGHPFFRLRPMTYKIPKSTETFPVWINYFNQLNIEIPEGKPGCNPGGIAVSGKLNLFVLKD